MVIEEAHYQSLLAGETETMMQNTDISNRLVCIFIGKHLFFKQVLLATSRKMYKKCNLCSHSDYC